MKFQDPMTSLQWCTLKAITDFLQPAYELTVQASGHYATLSMLPLIFESLSNRCNSTIDANPNSDFIFPSAIQAAKAMLNKIEKYKSNLTSPLAQLALALDPAIPNTESETESMKHLIRTTLTRDYGYRSAVQLAPEGKPKGLLAAARAARAPSGYNINVDEVEDFFDFTKKGDESCNDAVEWWGTIGRKRFPVIAHLARDTLMCMGSSVPSESSFSDSGHFVTNNRASLNDENIEKMMKLRSWNRLLSKTHSSSIG